MRPGVWIVRSSAAWLLFAGVTLFIACGRQQEGERCSTSNGSNDCAAGLTCVPSGGFPGICCPPKESSTLDVCKQQGTGVVPDTGTDTASDGASETSTDTGSDSASDSGTDTSDG